MGNTRLRNIEAVVRRVCVVANGVACGVLAFLVVVLVLDVFGRFVGLPVLGSYEIVQYGFGLVVCLAVAYATMESGHIVIDLVFKAFPKGIQRLCIRVSEILAMLMFALIVWRLGSDGLQSYSISERSTTLGIPVSIFEFALAAGFALLVVVILLQFLKAIGRGE